MTTGTRHLADALTDEISILNLPTDRDRTTGREYRPASETMRLDTELTERLAEAASTERASFAAVLVSTVQVLLQRLTGQTEVTVSVGVDRSEVRTSPALTLRDRIRMRSQLTGSQSFRELLKATSLAVGEVPTWDLAIDSTATLFIDIVDLSISIARMGSELSVACEYNANLLDAATVGRWLRAYKRLLNGVAANTETQLATLPWVASDDLRLMDEWNRTAADVPDACVHQLIEAQVRGAPGATAAECEGRSITYDALNRRANQVARRLRDLGVAKNMLVGLCVDRSIDMLAGLLGILKAGGAYVPLDPAYPGDRVAFMIADSGMSVLVMERALQGRVPVPTAVQVLFIDDPSVPALDDANLTVDQSGATSDSTAYVIYTSGSTGIPKGVLVPHRAVVNLLASVARRPGLAASDVVLAITTLSFDIAVSEILLPLTVGARIVIVPRTVASDGVELLRLIRDAGVTFVDATPSTWRLLIDAGWNGGEGLTAICTGEAMPRDVARELVDRAGRVWNGYGPTETTVWSTFWEVNRPVERILIGTPIANTRIYVLDERRQPVAVGVPGEIYIAGAGVTSGYLNRPDLTQARFLPDPFDASGSTMYRTGDLGRYLNSGELECLGRNDDQVKVRGYRIELGEIEDVLGRHEAVARAAVVAREDRLGERRLVAYIVTREGVPPADAALRAHVSRVLPDYMVPAAFVHLDALPLTPSGKVDRQTLPAPSQARGEGESFVAARTPTETMLAGLWQQVLGLERVSVAEDFFSLGGHSLLASQVLARLRRDHGIEIPFRTFFEAPTIAQLATVIDAQPRTVNSAARTIPRRRQEQASQLSVAQERIWLLETMDPQQRVVHNLPCAWRLSGELDEVALENSLNAIVARHETLRTAIGVQDGVPFLKVAPPAAFTLGRLDLRVRPAAEREAEMLAFCDREGRTPHDLSTAPLFRATLICLDRTEHVLYIVPHNLIWDGWSFDIFLHELEACYAAFIDGRGLPLPDIPISYRDFARWQREWLAGDESTQQRAWWRTQLAGTLPVLEMPSDRPRPEEPNWTATHVQSRLSREQVDALSAVSGRSGGTLFTILFAAFCLLVHRLSGQDDVNIGTPVRARTRPETEPLLGLFMNMLVLRSHAERNLSFSEFLAQVRARTLDAFTHQELPLEALDVRAPILRAFFTMEDGRQRSKTLGNLEVRPVAVMPVAVAADFRLSVTETREGASLIWSCSSELFNPATTQRFLKCFETLLGNLTRDPHQKIDAINLIPEEERNLLRTFGNHAPSADVRACAHTLFEHQARRRPDAEALVCGPNVVTYGELDGRATALAHVLATYQIGKGSRVAVYLPRSADLVISLLAVLKIGAIWVPLDRDDPPARLTAMLKDSGAAVVLTNSALRGRLPEAWPPVVGVEEAGDVGNLERANRSLATSATLIDANACLLYTSDAHRLRSAALSHRTLAAVVQALVHALPMTERDVALAVLPPSLDASTIELLAPLAAGARLVVAHGDSALEADYLAEMLGTSGATVVAAPATLWADLLAASASPWGALTAICVGHPLTDELSTELVSRTAAAWVAHGFTEAGIWTTLHRLSASEPATVLGRPLPHARVRILDRATGDAPIGTTGELAVGLDRTGSERGGTSLQPSDDLWYSTGEYARWRSDGLLELVRPRDREMPIDGFRIDLDDLSRVLRGLPPIKDALAAVRTRSSQRPRLVAYFAPEEDAAWTATELRRALRLLLPERMIPQSFVEVEAIPLGTDGRLALGDFTMSDAADEEDYVPPQTRTEVLLARLWTEALGLPRVGRHDNFFALGGYSLLCFQVLERIERETGRRVSPRLLLLDSLDQVAAQLDTMGQPAGDSPAGLARRGGVGGKWFKR
jgi:amino acid adenylation domain-containing protein